MIQLTMFGIQVKKIPNTKNIFDLFQNCEKHDFIFPTFFIIGPPLPYALESSAMAEFPYGVLLFGGLGGDVSAEEDKKEILKLHAGGISWKKLNITMKDKREAHVVIPLQ